jgi:hypothetical protein
MNLDERFKNVKFEKFFTHEQIEKIGCNAAVVSSWDFNTVLGQSLRERYETLYIKVHELTNVLVKNGAAGYFWVVCAPEVSSIFETSLSNFLSIGSEEFEKQIAMGNLDKDLQYKGLVNLRWRLYTDSQMEANCLIVGVNDTLEKPEHYARLSIINYFI